MRAENIQACLIPTTDPHVGEYTPAHWETRQWISGFTGSAGTVVVTLDKAGLWTDSRYFLQAEDQLQNTGIELFKMGLPDTPAPEAWLSGELVAGDTVGFEGAVYAASDALSLIAYFDKRHIRVNSNFAPYDQLWKDRPAIPLNKAFILSEQFSGESARSKIGRLLAEMRKQGCDSTVLASLDMVAWLFNLRGNDIEYNPVTVSYAVVSEKETVLFILPEKLTPEVTAYLQGEGVILAEYEKIYDYLSRLQSTQNVLITPGKINYRLYTSIPETCTIHEVNVHPVDYLKSIKNETEIAGIRRAMQRDGVALVQFFYGLDKQLAEGKTVTELDVSAQLKAFRSEQDSFFSESFETIAGYGAHGAIVHYAATPETNAPVLPEGILLIDSGAQYLDGTTDITRTISVGPVSDEMKKDYTNILKGHIQLSIAKFPKGTVGMQLDVLARQFIWKEGQNFGHGTGHGVGHFLNVHEGPQSIRMNYNPAPLQPGMVTSNEPGLYKTGQYGIRIENLLLTIPDKTTDFGDYYAFETLTLCPIDKKLIDWSLMSAEEIQWLEEYHQKVYEQLSPFLNEEEKEWLRIKSFGV
ncbi:MAG: aminopeptidase P family protein [Candidatus Symbiothrix sp.]|jgi:Xaa-Pro aminopeptidase|nr:aminopeptidase P family protein [Candidatus Symbiothrix sp.]